ncbi:coenzyme F420-dependent NADP oxidoreductase [Haloferax elongans ATCC BAA-1513]|uniref:Coenzyme F420-dependent NADP oxidoreductase n=1 Tax=Haloferax elongans ATCC BAA-1513 TaxID=1230453 RepID=M0HJN7_HALEO|nr:NADPH-dependent F420 reductase [Haloferax elongans]ELZ84770.1 coenzyme F420-dependent NADP oxidoreductase [Haloferax elongans ATCC BAA-1513]
MKIGILGAGKVGATAAQLFVEVGHEVAIANRSGPDSLADLAENLPRITPVEPARAVEFGELVLLAIPFRERETLPDAELFDNRIVVDAMNPYTEDYHVMDLGDATSSELIAKQLPGARVVKAFNTMYWETLRDKGHPEISESERFAIFLAGDDPEAKAVVADLVRDIGFGPVDTGSLEDGGALQEPGSVFYHREISTAEAREKVRQLSVSR